jgi:hypothetical protein
MDGWMDGWMEWRSSASPRKLEAHGQLQCGGGEANGCCRGCHGRLTPGLASPTKAGEWRRTVSRLGLGLGHAHRDSPLAMPKRSNPEAGVKGACANRTNQQRPAAARADSVWGTPSPNRRVLGLESAISPVRAIYLAICGFFRDAGIDQELLSWEKGRDYILDLALTLETLGLPSVHPSIHLIGLASSSNTHTRPTWPALRESATMSAPASPSTQRPSSPRLRTIFMVALPSKSRQTSSVRPSPCPSGLHPLPCFGHAKGRNSN